MMSHIEMGYAKTLRDLAEARAEIVRLKGEAQYGATFIQRAIDAERELAEVKEQLRLCNVDQFTTAAELAEAVTKERERCALKWKGITDKEAHALYAKYSAWGLIKAVEQLLRERNT